MNVSGEYRIPAPRNDVWNALNDTDLLKVCLPGCEELARTSATSMKATVIAGGMPGEEPGGPHIEMSLAVDKVVPPESYDVIGDAVSPELGTLHWTVSIQLEEVGPETVLHYSGIWEEDGALADQISKLNSDFMALFSESLGYKPDARNELDSGQIEEAKTLSWVRAGEVVEDVVEDAENEVEGAAARGFLGGPFMWGLIAIIILIVILALTHM